ncbi:MAG: NAD(P)H-binding protein [Polyangiaceae bacterium]
MKILLLGATGMVGQGVLRECLADPRVTRVVIIGRTPLGQQHEKLQEILHKDFLDFTPLRAELTGFDACFFCLGISASGLTEEAYHRITYETTLAFAQVLVEQSPASTFIYVSGAGTDSTEKGRFMWARVKGKTENALFKLPFKSAIMFRPGYIQPLHGIRSKTRLYRMVYAVMAPFFPFWRWVLPRYVTTTEDVGRAMLQVALHGTEKKLLENGDIGDLARLYSTP